MSAYENLTDERRMKKGEVLDLKRGQTIYLKKGGGLELARVIDWFVPPDVERGSMLLRVKNLYAGGVEDFTITGQPLEDTESIYLPKDYPYYFKKVVSNITKNIKYEKSLFHKTKEKKILSKERIEEMKILLYKLREATTKKLVVKYDGLVKCIYEPRGRNQLEGYQQGELYKYKKNRGVLSDLDWRRKRIKLLGVLHCKEF